MLGKQSRTRRPRNREPRVVRARARARRVLSPCRLGWVGAVRHPGEAPKHLTEVAVRIGTTMRRATNIVVVLVAVFALAGCGHPGGDPNGTVLQSLKLTTRVVPSGASHLSVRSSESVWVQACPEFQGAHAGWSSDQVLIQFQASPSANVIGHVDSRLLQLGWHRYDIVITHGQGPVPHWTLNNRSGRKADAFAFQAPSRSGHWALNLSWQPPGPKAEGCP